MRKVLLASTVPVAAIAFANKPKEPAAIDPAVTPPTDAPGEETAAEKAKSERIAPIIATVRTDVPIPAKVNTRGSKSAYDFGALTVVGASFGVANKTAKQMASVVSNANKKALVVKTDAAGNTIFKSVAMNGPDGKEIGRTPTTEPEMVAGKHYMVVDTDPATDPDNATSRVYRDK